MISYVIKYNVPVDVTVKDPYEDLHWFNESAYDLIR